ncbi:hypothetical protein [Enterococcus sp. CSURQ0835]|uniref:hypothetical protein n=1 Tax=Enterococcus sp. CSURQ0835 TaxID=2681394 RepID=UPI001356C1F0|nr:hypothetical protein [Enterococcus sp. CSURQ0835]
MKAVKRFGLVIVFLLLGTLIGQLGSVVTIIFFSGLFIVWFMLWDERKYDQEHRSKLTQKDSAESQTTDEYYFEDYHYIEQIDSHH